MSFNQAALHDPLRDPDLFKEKVEVLESGPKQRNLLDPGVSQLLIISMNNFPHFSKWKITFSYCHNAESLMQQLWKAFSYKSGYWRLFNDSCKNTLKAVLLHIRDQLFPVPSVHATIIIKSYETMKLLLSSIEYQKHHWKICGDLKVICLFPVIRFVTQSIICFLFVQ